MFVRMLYGMDTRLEFRLAEPVLHELHQLSVLTGLSIPNLVRSGISNHLDVCIFGKEMEKHNFQIEPERPVRDVIKVGVDLP